MEEDPIFKKPARRQVNPDTQEKTQKVYEGTYNIWYNKWTGQKHKGRFEIGERAPTRVNIEKDTGYTLADKRKQQNPTHKTYFCLQFARGCCYMGHKCEYMHRIPKLDDLEETMKDCFGRDRHRDERDDMNGVGCFNRENRTIYLGNLHPYDVSHGERVIRRHFSVFGEIERINVIHGKAIAFVRYKKRANAEFAKEAMEHQALDAGEMLNVRWANDDPNPRAQMEAKRKLEETFVHHYVAKKAKDAAVAATEATHLNLPSTSLTHSKSTMNSSSSSSSSSSLPLTQDPTLNHWIQQHPTFKQVYQYYQVQALPSPPPPPPPPPSMLPSSSSNPLHPLNASTSVHTPPTEATSLPSSSTLIPSVEPTPPSVALIAGYESEDEDEDGKEEKEVENEK